MTGSEENKVDPYEQTVLGGGQEDISERLAAIDDEITSTIATKNTTTSSTNTHAILGGTGPYPPALALSSPADATPHCPCTSILTLRHASSRVRPSRMALPLLGPYGRRSSLHHGLLRASPYPLTSNPSLFQF